MPCHLISKENKESCVRAHTCALFSSVLRHIGKLQFLCLLNPRLLDFGSLPAKHDKRHTDAFHGSPLLTKMIQWIQRCFFASNQNVCQCFFFRLGIQTLSEKAITVCKSQHFEQVIQLKKDQHIETNQWTRNITAFKTLKLSHMGLPISLNGCTRSFLPVV